MEKGNDTVEYFTGVTFFVGGLLNIFRAADDMLNGSKNQAEKQLKQLSGGGNNDRRSKTPLRKIEMPSTRTLHSPLSFSFSPSPQLDLYPNSKKKQ